LDEPFELRHDGALIQLPSWRFGSHVIWGMTHRILGDLIELVESGERSGGSRGPA